MLTSGTEHLSTTLAVAYSWTEVQLQRLFAGTATVNYIGHADDRRIFVKEYPTGTDLDTECAAIELSEFAAAAGLPTAGVIRSTGGSLIHRSDGAAYSVWEFVSGEPGGRSGLSRQELTAVGGMLGHLHRVLADHPAARPVVGPASGLCDIDRAIRKFEKILAALLRTPDPDEFEVWAGEVIRWRLRLMPEIAGLLAGLPGLTSQILHGDLAAPNVLFHEGRVTGLIDFRPPRPRSVAWEVSRIGCEPRSVLQGEEWLRGLCSLAAAYREEHSQARPEDLVSTARAWICYTATSTYPFDELIKGAPVLADSLKTYARDRQEALVMLMDDLATVEESLHTAIR